MASCWLYFLLIFYFTKTFRYLSVFEEDERRILRKKANPNGRRTLQSAPQNVPMGARKEYQRRENDGRTEKRKERGKQPAVGETRGRIQDESLRRKNKKTDQADSGNISRTIILANARFLLAVKPTTKRASSPASWLSERQKIIRCARSEDVGSLQH